MREASLRQVPLRDEFVTAHSGNEPASA